MLALNTFTSITMFSTKTLRLDKKIQKALSVSPMMDSPNLSKMVLDYIHPITKRYLYSIDVSIEFKEEVQRNYGDDFYPIDFFLFVLAKDEKEAATELIKIIEKFHFQEELDFSVESILGFKQRYEDTSLSELCGIIKRKNKSFYTTAPIVLYHTETQLYFDEIYRYPRKDKRSGIRGALYAGRSRSEEKTFSRLQDFPVMWF